MANKVVRIRDQTSEPETKTPEVVAEVKASPKVQSAQESRELKPEKNRRNRKDWLLLMGGIGLILFGLLMGLLWNQNKDNPILGVLLLAGLAGGGMLVYKQLFGRDDSRVVVVPGGKTKVENANSLCIYGRKDPTTGRVYAEKIAFEYINPDGREMGQPQQCINTGKYYYTLIWDIEKQELVPFVLPDARYVDPAIMARYLSLKAQRKYLRHRESLMKYVGPGILALVDAGGFIAIIALAG